MNQIINDMQPGNGECVDGVLRRFFHAEMPHPWPECAASAQARQTPRPSRFGAMARLALAAAVALFFAGYLALAGLFPQPKIVPSDRGQELGGFPGKSHKLNHSTNSPQK
jgi:hypothetical protein